jgi:hypothetical protein
MPQTFLIIHITPQKEMQPNLNNSSETNKKCLSPLKLSERPQLLSGGYYSVYADMSCHGQKFRASYGIHCKQSEMKQDKKTKKWKFVGDVNTRLLIDKYNQNMMDAYTELLLSKQIIDIKYIAKCMKGKPVIEEVKTPDFIKAMIIYVQAYWFDEGTNFNEKTRLKGKRFFEHIAKWAKIYFGREIIELKEIKSVHDKEIIKFILSGGTGIKSANNHANMHVQRLKGFFDYAVGMNWINRNPFQNFKTKHEKVKIKYLTASDVQRLEDLTLTESSVYDVARDLFLFTCYTGLAYMDLKNVSKSHIKADDSGFKFLEIPRLKTDVTSIIPLSEKAKILIGKYEQREIVYSSD